MISQPDEIRSMADKLAVKLTTFVNNNQELCLDAISGIQLASGLRPTIEKALRTVSDRAYSRGKSDGRIEEAIGCDAHATKAYREGQESMRERAAEVADFDHAEMIAAEIRALKPAPRDA